MSFQIELDKYDEAYGSFLRTIRIAIQKTFAEEVERQGLTQAQLSRELKVAASVVSRRLSGTGNVTLRTICDLYVAMGREPLSNFQSADKVVGEITEEETLEEWVMPNIGRLNDPVTIMHTLTPSADYASNVYDPQLNKLITIHKDVDRNDYFINQENRTRNKAKEYSESITLPWSNIIENQNKPVLWNNLQCV